MTKKRKNAPGGPRALARQGPPAALRRVSASPTASAQARDRVLDAAARLFRDRGYHAVGLREVAARAGLLLGSLQYRFRTKDELLLGLMERAVEQMSQAIEEAARRQSDPALALRAALEAHLTLLLSRDDSAVLLQEWRALTGRARTKMIALRDRYEAVWSRLLASAMAAGYARPGADPHLVRLFGFGAINWVAQWYRPDGGRTPAQIADAFWSYFAFGLLGPGAPLQLEGEDT